MDAVLFCTQHKFHAEQIAAAAHAGKHVFCENPLTVRAEDAVHVLDAVAASGLQIGIGHERRFEPAVMRLRKACRSGELGTPLVMEGNFSQDKFLDLPADNWRLSEIEAPVGPLSATGIHLVDLATAIFGGPVDVWAPVHAGDGLCEQRHAHGNDGLRARSDGAAMIEGVDGDSGPEPP